MSDLTTRNSELESRNFPLGATRNSLAACLADLIFPPRCPGCGMVLKSDAGPPFCSACFSRITFITEPLCPCCGMPFQSQTGENHLCGDCINAVPPFIQARSVGTYNGILLEAIHRFKYNRHMISGRAIARLMALYPFPSFVVDADALIIPVPLHPQRMRQRGFNQAVFLGKEIARYHRLRIRVDLLCRKVHTLPQFDLGRDERGSNVQGAFMIQRPREIEGKRVILVDDVYTTGSTVKECTRTLLSAGAERVEVLTLARAL